MKAVIARRRATYSHEFEAFWDAYPGGGIKKKAAQAWERAGLDRDPELRADMLRAIRDRLAHEEQATAAKAWQPDWPHAERWLRNEGWNDKLYPFKPGAAGPMPMAATKAAITRQTIFDFHQKAKEIES